MTDVDIIKSEPMDLNDDEKGSDTEKNVENGDDNNAVVKEEEEEADDVIRGKVVQVTNVSPGATIQQLATLFGFLGTVTDIRLYPSDEAVPVQVKVCYVNYESNEQCGVAQHLTNTVFIDKALIVVPINREEIPEESECQHLIKSINAYATLSSTGYLPNGFPPEEPGCSIPGIPPPPVITSSTDPVEIEEIKRTIFVQNIDEKVTSEQVMAFFSGVGEVKYMRVCKKEPTKYAFIEFSGPESVPTALQYNGVIFGGKCLKVEHAKSPIVKPESERIASGRNPLRTGRDVVKRPTSANWGMRVINAHIGDTSPTNESLRRSRSRSRSRRSRSRGRTSIARSKPRSRSGSRSRRRKSRSKSPRRRPSPPARSPRRKSRSRSRSRTKRRSRSRTRSPVRRRRRSVSRSRSRSRSFSKRRRSRSRSRSRERRRRRRSGSRSTSRSPRRSKKKSKSRSRSPRRRKSKRSSSKSPDRRKSKGKDKDKEEKKDRNKDKSKEKEKEKSKDKSKEKEKEISPEKDLKSLLDKVYSYEEDKERERQKEKDKEVKTAEA